MLRRMFEWMLHNKCFCLTVWLENILLHRCLHSNYFCINKKYFLFCDWTWKESIQCILSVKLRAPQRIWFHANCHHSNYQILKWKVLPVLWPSLNMFDSVYYQSQVHGNYFSLKVRLENIPWRLLVKAV